MVRDPIIEEVRAIRDAFAKKHRYDVRAIVRALHREESKSKRTLVPLPPKRLTKKARAGTALVQSEGGQGYLALSRQRNLGRRIESVPQRTSLILVDNSVRVDFYSNGCKRTKYPL